MAEEPQSEIPEDLAFSEEHEWISVDSDIATIGITDYAQSQLGDIVFVELPEVGAELKKGESMGTVEAVKTVEDIYAPVSGEVVEANQDLEDNADMVNDDPYGAGWIVKIRMEDPSELDDALSATDYRDHIDGA